MEDVEIVSNSAAKEIKEALLKKKMTRMIGLPARIDCPSILVESISVIKDVR